MNSKTAIQLELSDQSCCALAFAVLHPKAENKIAVNKLQNGKGMMSLSL